MPTSPGQAEQRGRAGSPAGAWTRRDHWVQELPGLPTQGTAPAPTGTPEWKKPSSLHQPAPALDSAGPEPGGPYLPSGEKETLCTEPLKWKRWSTDLQTRLTSSALPPAGRKGVAPVTPDLQLNCREFCGLPAREAQPSFNVKHYAHHSHPPHTRVPVCGPIPPTGPGVGFVSPRCPHLPPLPQPVPSVTTLHHCLLSLGHWWLPSSTMMASRPSGDSPTHLTLYRVVRGRVLDLLLRDKNQSREDGLTLSDGEAGTTRSPAPRHTPPVPGARAHRKPLLLTKGKTPLENICHSILNT